MNLLFCANSYILKLTRQIYIMNIHEYQGKEILASYGVRIQRGCL
jgi:succinyl-CoA synthetase beta subunit